MQNKYKRLSLFEREVLAIGLAKGKSLRSIAMEMNRSHTTLSRELKTHHHSKPRDTYSPCISNDIARVFKRRAGRKKSMHIEFIRQYVEEKIREGWSPEQISGRLSIDHPSLTVSHETIYRYIYDEADYLVGYLARRHKFRRKKKPYRREKKSKIPNRICIDRRSEVINKRSEFGHWESDSIVSSKSDVALNVLIERVSRKVKITRLIDRKSATTAEAILERLRHLPFDIRKSITYDNGSENCRHEKISALLGIIAYFCNPYHSWEKGGVENINGLIRRYVPKKMDLSKLTEKDIKYVENQLNNRPKKCLGYRTPNEVFNTFLPGGAIEV